MSLTQSEQDEGETGRGAAAERPQQLTVFPFQTLCVLTAENTHLIWKIYEIIFLYVNIFNILWDEWSFQILQKWVLTKMPPKHSQQRDRFKVLHQSLHQSFFHFMQSQRDHHLSYFLWPPLADWQLCGKKQRNVSFLVVFDQNNASVGVWSDEPAAAAAVHHPALQGSVDLFFTAYSRENEMYVTVHANNMSVVVYFIESCGNRCAWNNQFVIWCIR